MMVILASIMGSIIAETTQAEHIEHLIKPVKDLFGAIFFVSVGMLIDPTTLYEYVSCTYFNFNHHLRTIHQLHYWCFNFRTAFKTIHTNWNEFSTN
jgi:predicted Kef-type K+ transport protein